MLLVQFEINSILLMFGNFAKLDSPRRLNRPIFPNISRTINESKSVLAIA